MQKTINLELSKRLAPYLENIKTSETIFIWWKRWEDFIKTLTLEEAIDFLPFKIILWNGKYFLEIQKRKDKYFIEYVDNRVEKYLSDRDFSWKSILEWAEKMLEYLLDNNLLGK